MNSNTATLAFEGISFNPVSRDQQVWLRLPQIEVALGYTKRGALQTVFARHADEFTTSMTRVIRLATAGGKQAVRVFSLRGAHLLAMFARTEVAKRFRRWVLDILDREVAGMQTRPIIDDNTRRDIEGLCTQAEFLRSWWERFGPGIRLLNRTAAGNVHDSFIYAATSSRSIVRTLGLMSNTEFARRYPWEADYMERMEYQRQMVAA